MSPIHPGTGSHLTNSPPRYNQFLEEGSRQEFLKFAAEFDAPAFVRRAQHTQQSTQEVFGQCEQQREQLLELSKKRLAILAAMVDESWAKLEPLLVATPAGESTNCWNANYLANLFESWCPTLRVQIEPTSSKRKLRTAIKDLAIAFDHFNRKWCRYLDEFDLSSVNQIRADYNNYYVLEKACAFGSEKIALDGFEPLDRLTREQLLDRFPLLRLGHAIGR